MKLFLIFPFIVSLVAASRANAIAKLGHAAENDNVDLAREALREVSADTPINDEGVTALMLSAECGSVNMIRFLTQEAGASINATDNFGCTPLHFACGPQGSVIGLKECLTISNVQVNAQETSQGNTPLHLAAANGFAGHIGHLVRAGAGLEIQNSIGNTPIIAAAYKDNVLAVTILSRFGADHLAINNRDQDALAIASNCNSLNVARFLLDLINPTKENYNTGIMRAMGYATTPEMRELLQEYYPGTISFVARSSTA